MPRKIKKGWKAGLSVRAANSLWEFESKEELKTCNYYDLLKIPGLGKETAREIETWLGVSLERSRKPQMIRLIESHEGPITCTHGTDGKTYIIMTPISRVRGDNWKTYLTLPKMRQN